MILSAMRRTCPVSWLNTLYSKSASSVLSDIRSSHSLSTTASPPLISQTSSHFLHHPLVVSSSISPSDIPQKSQEWFALRKHKLTSSTFSTALGFWKKNRRSELWHEKVYGSESRVLDDSAQSAMSWGLQMESAAIEKYKTIMGCDVGYMGFAMHSQEQFHWLGASPDGVLHSGILEVKCPYNKGKTDTVLPWSKVPFYYMPQMQGQMEIMDREWVDLYCWTRNGSTVFRVMRDRSYWGIIHDVLKEFWWENVIPAREGLLLGKDVAEVKKLYEPSSTHKRTGLAIAKSISLAAESKLVCREIADHVEFF